VGSALEDYAPWKGYETPKRRSVSLELPHTRLIRLGTECRERRLDDGKLRVAATSFGAECGLLGLALQETLQVSLWPVWQAFSSKTPALVPTQRRYFRSGAAWSAARDRGVVTGKKTPGLRGAPVPRDLWPPGWSVHAITVGHEGEPAVRPIVESWGRFFPYVPPNDAETFQYPLPFTADFWKQYAEPLEDVVKVASRFRDAADALQKAQTDRMESGSATRALEFLELTAAPVHMVMNGNPWALSMHWAGTSLLAQCAAMLLHDLSTKGTLFTCRTCGTITIRGNHKTDRCSRRCAARERKREERKRAQLVTS